MSLPERFARALGWIDKHSLPGTGIAVSSRLAKPYPEVSGCCIPSLLQWNEKARARAYGRWLVSIQHSSGAWGDANENQPYAFDSGQILKGLLALAHATGEQTYRKALVRGCEWIVSLIDDSGAVSAPDFAPWGDQVPHGVLLSSLEAVKRAGEFLGEPRFIDPIDKGVQWFLAKPRLTEFRHLSHFHAHIPEALCDLGMTDRAAEAMTAVGRLQRDNGAVPAFPNVEWVCSTGLFQYAITWYKLGDLKRGDRALEYATGLQNRSGGWFGSYGPFCEYFPDAEIAWAVKHFLDALHWRLRVSFEDMSHIFHDSIARTDGRYELVRDAIRATSARTVLDAGCGKGRYLRNLVTDCPGIELHGSDISTRVMSTIPAPIKTARGSLLQLPYPDAHFDLVYTVEALEHAVHIDGAVRELVRVLRPGGQLIIVDKNRLQLGRMTLPDWEVWFDTQDLARKLEGAGTKVVTRENVAYEGRADGLFTAWIAHRQDTVHA